MLRVPSIVLALSLCTLATPPSRAELSPHAAKLIESLRHRPAVLPPISANPSVVVHSRAGRGYFTRWIGYTTRGTYPSPDGQSRFRLMMFKMNIKPSASNLAQVWTGFWEAVEYANKHNITVFKDRRSDVGEPDGTEVYFGVYDVTRPRGFWVYIQSSELSSPFSTGYTSIAWDVGGRLYTGEAKFGWETFNFNFPPYKLPLRYADDDDRGIWSYWLDFTR
jgi:hypothetical protein